MNRKEKMLEIIRKVVREVLQQRRDEANVTANIDGYATPFAFQKVPPRTKDIKKQYSHLGSSAYTERVPTKKLFKEKNIN